MNDGRAVQVGTPAELFERPEHTFVGYFIGSPGMNLLRAEVRGAEARVDGHVLPLGAHYPALRTGQAVKLGIRPDYACLTEGDGLPVTVTRVDDLGRKLLAHVSLGSEGSQTLVASVPRGLLVEPGPARLRLDPAKLHVYVDERRVRGAEP